MLIVKTDMGIFQVAFNRIAGSKDMHLFREFLYEKLIWFPVSSSFFFK